MADLKKLSGPNYIQCPFIYPMAPFTMIGYMDSSGFICCVLPEGHEGDHISHTDSTFDRFRWKEGPRLRPRRLEGDSVLGGIIEEDGIH